MHDDIQEVLLSEERILAGIDRVAAKITEAYSGTDLVVVSVLKGSCIFASDLIRRLPIPLQLGFVAAGSYGKDTTPRDLQIQLMPSDEDVIGRRVLLVDDILDTGRTLSAVARALRERGCADVRTCVFLDKPGRRAVPFEADYRAFEVDDVFVVGYGLDFAGMYRNLPYVASLKPAVIAASNGTDSEGGLAVSDTFVVPLVRAGMELDEFLCLQYPDCNKGFIRQQIRSGHVLLDGVQALPSKRLRTDQVLYVTFDELESPAPPVAPEAEIPILHETDDWLVVDKPSDLAVEPERWAREKASLSGALLQLVRDRRETEGEIPYRLRLVHRIDKDTSGAVLVAKNIETERFLRTAFEEGRVRKRYLALVEGEHPLREGDVEEIDMPLGPDERKSGRVMVRAKDGKPSRTRVEVERRFHGYTLLACEPVTGRTHQIRVHLAETGFPLAVDPIYGRRDAFFLSSIKPGYKQKPGRKERPLIDRLTLHAARIGVPVRGDVGAHEEVVWVEAPLPKDFSSALKQLDKLRRWNW